MVFLSVSRMIRIIVSSKRKMYESCRKHNFSYIVFYIYIYIFKCFLTFSCKISKIHKEMRHSERKLRKPLCISVKTNKTNHSTVFARIFHAFCSVFVEIYLFGNDNGEYSHHFLAEQTTHTRHRCKNKSASRNIPPATRLCFMACRMAVFFDFSKKFWYNLYRKERKYKIFPRFS